MVLLTAVLDVSLKTYLAALEIAPLAKSLDNCFPDYFENSLKAYLAYWTKTYLHPPLAIYLAVLFPIYLPPSFTAYLVAWIEASLAAATETYSAVYMIAEAAPQVATSTIPDTTHIPAPTKSPWTAQITASVAYTTTTKGSAMALRPIFATPFKSPFPTAFANIIPQGILKN